MENAIIKQTILNVAYKTFWKASIDFHNAWYFFI